MSFNPEPQRRTTATCWSIRWDEQQAARAYAQGWWGRETCADALRASAADDPMRVVLRQGETALSAGSLIAASERLAGALLRRFDPGSVVSFMLPNWHEAAVIYMAATMAGMVANPILPSLREHDLRFILQDAGTCIAFIPQQFRGHDYAEMLQAACSDLPSPPLAATVRGGTDAQSFESLASEAGSASLPQVDPDDVRMLMYTSGTTGRPKGVLHTHNSLGALIRQIGRHWLVEPGDRFLVASPISHIGGSIYAFECPAMLGTAAVLMESWDAAVAVELMQRHRITHMAGATPFLRQLLDVARAAGISLPDLKVFICGGASVPPALIREATDHFSNARVCRVYGSTEVPVTTVGVLDRGHIDSAAETDGRPGLADIRLAPDGEIRAKGPQMLLGYINPADEAGSFDEDGFFRTGDQGRWENGDHLVVTGRIKDLIIRNGENIAPKEIEDLLLGHPDVAEIAIVGVPDAKTGERAVAVVVPAAGATPDVPALAAHLAGAGVAKFKYPESVALWDSLPKNDAGKVLKQAIRERLLRG
ncbi:AMP-binding protein [Sphingomonas tabacisoli]|uniref:AMP-binding protein n=1 Tax=Sphingomonas tabacisoli TaxID=2249466 RepID=A0ABW4I787_9SPHN